MDNQQRRKLLEEFTKQFKEGIPFAEEFISIDPNDIRDNALLARDLTEDALAEQVLKNTGVPIPNKGASRLKQEDFLNRVLDETYPEFKGNPNLSIGDRSNYYEGKILIDSDGDLIRKTSNALHEGGHKFDDEILKKQGSRLLTDKDLHKISKTRNLKDIDPAEVYEMLAASDKARHHVKIPDVRENSFGMSNLKNVLKGGKIRQLVGPALGIGLGLATGNDAMAAIPILGDSEDVGSSDDDFEIIGEVEGQRGYDKSKARQDRLNMLSTLKGEI